MKKLYNTFILQTFLRSSGVPSENKYAWLNEGANVLDIISLADKQKIYIPNFSGEI